jgi:diguanylate cyclase (GGDEF)-like protein/PAS domain S-box-containing protein
MNCLSSSMTNPPDPPPAESLFPASPPSMVAGAGMRALSAVLANLRDHPDRGVADLLIAIEAICAKTLGNRCVIWLVASDGARMRSPSGATPPWTPYERPITDPTNWQPITGPVADVMAVRQPIELGLSPEPGRRNIDPLVRSFARVVPIRNRGRIVAALAVVRDTPQMMFDADDRLIIDAIVERIEAAFVAQDLRDELISARTSPISLNTGGTGVVSESLFNRLATVGGDVVFRHRFGAGTEYVSASVRAVMGYSAEEFLSDPGLARRIIHPEDRHLLARLGEDRASYDHQILLRTVTRDGTVVWQLVRARPILDGDRIIGIEGLATDVSMMKRTEAALSHQARSDPLTNLANRVTLNEYATRSIARLKRHPGMVALLYLDLTGFKQVNDTLGHPAGDSAIVAVAERLSKVTRREDVVARVGGDEFAVLIPELGTVNDATATAQRIITSIETPIEVDGQLVRISTGVGVAVINSPAVEVDELLGQADSALLQAKRSGRGRWQVYQGAAGNASGPDRGVRSTQTDQLTPGAVRAAFASGSFEVHYLPVIDATTGSCSRVEALLRWQHLDLGLLDADDFLHLCEEADLLQSIDDWVLAQACRQIATWNDRLSSPLGLSVNISPGKLSLSGFSDAVLSMLSATAVAPHLLTVELPEPAVTELTPGEVAQLETVRAAGVRISIDRFGLGSTSLRALRRLPIDEIKIDRTLVAVLDPGRSARDVDVEITKLALQVSQSFGAATIAVGVERAEQAHALLALGCSLVQGRVYQGAVNAATIESTFVNGELRYPALSPRSVT